MSSIKEYKEGMKTELNATNQEADMEKGLIELGWMGTQPIANIIETTKGYYHATSPDGGLDMGSTNLQSLKALLKKYGYVIGSISRWKEKKIYSVFNLF